MKSSRPWILLTMAVASGGLAALIALQYLRPRSLSPIASRSGGSQRVAVATRNLSIGVVVASNDVKLVEWPSQALPEGYLSTAEQVVGRGVITPIQANEPLLAAKLAGAGAGGGLAVSIPEGMRAVSVRVDEVVAVAGFVTPGTRVDVLVTLNRLGAGREVTTRVVLQNMQVLAAGQSVERDRDGKPLTVTVITVLTTPAQAEVLALASIEGRIQLALRPSLDTVEVATSGASIQQLLGAAPPVRALAERRVRILPSPTPEARATVVEGILGGQRVLTTFGRDSRTSE